MPRFPFDLLFLGNTGNIQFTDQEAYYLLFIRVMKPLKIVLIIAFKLCYKICDETLQCSIVGKMVLAIPVTNVRILELEIPCKFYDTS